MKQKIILSALILSLSLGVSGCGKDVELDAYKENMNGFYEVLANKSDSIDMIDPTSDTAVEDLLTLLDDINTEFTNLGEMSVPKQFESIEPLADDAASYMSEANRLYHEAYADGGYDSNIGDAARENYERAMKRISYIADIFRGEVPDDENVTVITEDSDGGFSTEGSEHDTINADFLIG